MNCTMARVALQISNCKYQIANWRHLKMRAFCARLGEKHSTGTVAASGIPGSSLLFVAFAVIASLVPGVAEALQYDRQAVAQGAWWRIVSGHFVHWSGEHLFWDVLALGLLGAEWFLRKRKHLL